MTCKNQQVKLLMKTLKKCTLQSSAATAGMDVKTARKYKKSGKLPAELSKLHTWKTRKDPFSEVSGEIDEMLNKEPSLQAKTVFTYFQSKYPARFMEGQLRTLQRHFQQWRAQYGKEKSVIFPQIHQPGHQSQSDYTVMNSLKITISGAQFDHLLFHFMLVYSRWEYVEICYSERFDTLAAGFENAAWKLGFVTTEHRTDNLTAATKQSKNKRDFTDRWKKVMNHYDVAPTKNNPGESHENGSIEKSHDLFKKAVDQQLMLRGSRDFDSIETYNDFLSKLVKQRNLSRKTDIEKELVSLKKLPKDRWCSPKQMNVRVSPSSTVQILGIPYSVPSRLISLILRAFVCPDKIDLYYGQRHIQTMPKIAEGYSINYRHIISSLIRKPGAFKNYQYRKALFPRISFRKAYDVLYKANKTNGHKDYLTLLYFAKKHGEQEVNTAIELLLENNLLPVKKEIKQLLDIPVQIPKVRIDEPDLNVYNQLRPSVTKKEVAA